MTNLNLSHLHLHFTLKVIFRFSSLAVFSNNETNLYHVTKLLLNFQKLCFIFKGLFLSELSYKIIPQLLSQSE